MMASDTQPSRTAASGQLPRSATSGGLIPVSGLVEYLASYYVPAAEPEPWKPKAPRKPRRPVPNGRCVVPRLRMPGHKSPCHQAALAVRQLRA